MTFYLSKANTTIVASVSSATALLCEADQAGMRCRSERSLKQCLDINTGSCALCGYHRESAAVPHLQKCPSRLGIRALDVSAVSGQRLAK